MKKILLASAAAVVLSMPALANDFSGPYAGLSAGYTWGEIDYSYEDGTTGFGDFSDSQDIDGFEGGIFLGYRHRFPSGFVLGLEGGFDAISGVDGTYTTAIGANTASVEFEKSHQFFVDLKPGFLIQDNLLAYGLVGYQRAELEAEAFLNGASLGSADDDFDAWRIGAGLEHAIDEKFTVRGQFHYADYDSNSYDYVNAQSERYDGDETAIRIGIAYNF